MTLSLNRLSLPTDLSLCLALCLTLHLSPSLAASAAAQTPPLRLPTAPPLHLPFWGGPTARPCHPAL